MASTSKTPKSAGKASDRKQRTLLSFFSKTGDSSPIASPNPKSIVSPSSPVPSSEAPVQSSPVPATSARLQVPQRSSPPAVSSSPLTRSKYVESSDDEEVPVKARKRRRNPVDPDEAEFVADDYISNASDDFVVPDDASEDDVPSKKRRKGASKAHMVKASAKSTPSTARYAFSPKSGNATLPTPSKTASKLAANRPAAAAKKDRSEQRYKWLVEVQDADGNPPNHPDYDRRTLYIPPPAWKEFTAFEKQYWEIKSKNYDTVVFFKKGKFYELYEDDATIGHQQFDLKLTDRVNMRMVGVPESSLYMWTSQFIAKGHKVARVDQCETALGKEMREKGSKGPSEDKIIKRQLACVLTGGTLVEEGMLQDEMSTFCAAIKEDEINGRPHFGVCFVDTATGSFFLSEFEDDSELTKFETLMAQIKPKELIIEKGHLSTQASRILKHNTYVTTIWNKLKPGKEFWDAGTTCRELDAQQYFPPDETPSALQAAQGKDLVFSAFGALLCYLQSLKIDSELVSLKNFATYDPIKAASSLILDGKTLLNLEIFSNSHDGSTEGTLFNLVNKCTTPFGKRLLKQWLCHPLIDVAKINERLDAVDAINANDVFRQVFVEQLARLPDLERLISRVHAGTCRAADFVRVLEGFEQIQSAVDQIKEYGDGDGLIGRLIAALPDLEQHLTPWKTAFDWDKARSDGVLVPETGVEEDFDNSQQTIEGITAELHSCLKSYISLLKCRDLRFVDFGKEIYAIEVPIKAAKEVPKSWNQLSATQKVKRFYSPEVRKLVRTLQEAQETHSQIVKEVASRFYQRFDANYAVWLEVTRVISTLDCLVGLAKTSRALGEPSCRPVFSEETRTAINFEELRHPCMSAGSTDDFIPNDVCLGGALPNICLLTGANAAGKSTVLRMTCIGVIMAQIGCYVPARYAQLSPVDRIMSRLGANDNIFAAQSTFFVELSETKKILSEATPRSLVILDELGRGTSSYDGVAVAQSVLHHIATHIGCVGFFATHYHSLASEFSGHSEIIPRRMKIAVDDTNREITFLYKLEEGVAEGSFGMHCAAMCGVNDRIITRAEEAAKNFEHTSKLKDSLEAARSGVYIPLGVQSDIALCIASTEGISKKAMDILLKGISSL